MTDSENAGNAPRNQRRPSALRRSRHDHLGGADAGTVTPGAMDAAERMRRMRARKKAAAVAAPMLYERADWTLFLRPETLPQKAGCDPGQIGRVVLKELLDNALDAGGDASLSSDGDCTYTISDDGPGIAPADVPRLFAVNRPLLSSKLKRLPLRGMLGNGLRVVMGAVGAAARSRSPPAATASNWRSIL
jgi:hypothetical protein